MERFSYKGGCGIRGRTRIETCKTRDGFEHKSMARVTDKRIRIISNIILSYTTKTLKNKAILSLNNILRLLLHGSTIKACFMLSSV